jgi:hypothetical protein
MLFFGQAETARQFATCRGEAHCRARQLRMVAAMLSKDEAFAETAIPVGLGIVFTASILLLSTLF